MKGLLWTFLVIVCLFSFSLPLWAEKETQGEQETPVIQEGSEVSESDEEPNQAAPSQMDIVFVMDNSVTMGKADPDFMIKKAISPYINGLGINTRAALVAFDEKARLLLSLVSVTEDGFSENVLSALEKLDYTGQFTNPAAALEEALYELKNKGNDNVLKIIVFISNGLVNTGDEEKDDEVKKLLNESLASDAQDNNISIFSLAAGEDADYLLFQDLAKKTKADYFRLPQVHDIEETLSKLSVQFQMHRGQKTVSQSDIEGLNKESNSLATIIIAVVVILIIALGTVGIVVLVIVKGGKKTPKTQKKESLPSSEEKKPEPKAVEPETSSLPHGVPEAELRDLSQVTDKDSFEVKIPVTSIGREYGNDIIIPKNTVSSKHATIEYRGGYFYLVDHRSSNGTFLNGAKIPGEVKLKSGDLLAFDVFKFQFIIPTLTALGLGPKKGFQGADDSGMTILRPQQRSPVSNDASRQGGPQIGSQKKKQESSPSSGEGQKTMHKPRTCPNHPEWWATKTCSQCKGVFCIQCVNEEEGKVICHQCENNS